MNYLSVCSGIEAATCAWHPLGWTPFAFSEIEPFPCIVLAHHYPNTPNLGDMTKFKEWPDATIDLLVGGTPCQSFSVAGLRKGLDDPRGNLMLTYLAIAAKYQPKWVVWENVPGVLSSNGGNDFASLLRGLGELGYGFAYRILDAQYFGVAQRRRRVFVVGHLGDWRRAAAVLFERHSLSGNPAPSRKKGEEVAGTFGARTTAGGGFGGDFETTGGLRAVPHADISPAIKARDSKGVSSDGDGDGAILVPMVAHSLPISIQGTMIGRTESSGPAGKGWSDDGISFTLTKTDQHAIAFDCKASGQSGFGVGDIASTLRSMGHSDSHQNGGGHAAVMTLAIRGRGDSHDLEYRTDGTANALLTPNGGRAGIGVGAVAFAQNQRDEVRLMDVAGALAAEPGAKQQTYAHVDMQVRRLTPRECERLQGFEDDYTNILVRGKPAADGTRYKALGNSMAVPCMVWIGRRIAMVEQIKDMAKAAAA